MDLRRIQELAGIRMLSESAGKEEKFTGKMSFGTDNNPKKEGFVATFGDYDGAPDSDHPIGRGATKEEAAKDLCRAALNHTAYEKYSESSIKAACKV